MALSNLTTTYQKDYSGLRSYKGINIRVQSAKARAAGPSFYDEIVKIMSNEINRPATSAGREANMYDVRFCKYDLIRTKLYDYRYIYQAPTSNIFSILVLFLDSRSNC